jgi:hypothetical protein
MLASINMAGRPPIYTEEIGNAICEWIADGKSLLQWCKLNDYRYGTVMAELSRNKLFADNYAHARADQAHKLAEEIIQIADDGENDTYIDDDGKVRTDHDAINRSRLRVDARKWYAGKLLPKKYGEKLELAGGLEVKKSTSDMTDAELAAIATRLPNKQATGDGL